MSTDNDNNISSGPADDGALPNASALEAAMNLLLGSGRPAPAPEPPKAEPSTSTPSPRPIARPGAAQGRLSIAQEIAALEGSPAWADGSHKDHARTITRLTELYQQKPDETPARSTSHPMQHRAQASRAAVQKRIDALESSAEWSKGDPATIARLRELYLQRDPPPETDPLDLPHVGDLRRMAGVEGPRGLPSPFAERWSHDVESEYLAIGVKAGIPGHALQSAVDWYLKTGLLGGAFDRGFTKEHETEFIEAAPSMGLSVEQAKGIVAWFRAVEKDAR